MPLYFFNLRSEDKPLPALETDRDPELKAVRRQARITAKQTVASALLAGSPLSEALAHTFEISDEDGATVLRMPFAEAVEADTRAQLRLSEACRST